MLVSRWRQSATNFNIEDRLIQNYNNLPRDFRLADVMRFCGFKPDEKKLVSQQVVRLWKLGLIHRSAEGRFWTKRYVKIESWFKAFVDGKTAKQKRKATPELEMTEIKSVATELPFPEL